ncbi:MAG: glycosyltransferase family 2 protein [Thermodesulfobacteriota bacterium]
MSSKKLSVSVVMPVFNEREFVLEVIKRVTATGIPAELIVVDDCSVDGTRDLLAGLEKKWPYKECRLKLILKEKNMGKGAALRTALENVTGDVVIVQDADLEYDPRDYEKLLEPIIEGRADVVYGSRFMGNSHRVLFFWHMVGNKVLTFFSNMLTNINLSDMETGYKAFRTEVLRSFTLESDRFGFEPEVTAKVARGRYRIYETSISYAGRTYDEGKKINWKDGVAAFWHIIKYNLLAPAPRR